MRFLTEFEFTSFEVAASVLNELITVYELNRCITYADVFKLVNKDLKLPDLYYKVGWTDVYEAKVEDNILKMGPIKNIEKIILVKENKDERTINENS